MDCHIRVALPSGPKGRSQKFLKEVLLAPLWHLYASTLHSRSAVSQGRDPTSQSCKSTSKVIEAKKKKKTANGPFFKSFKFLRYRIARSFQANRTKKTCTEITICQVVQQQFHRLFVSATLKLDIQ